MNIPIPILKGDPYYCLIFVLLSFGDQALVSTACMRLHPLLKWDVLKINNLWHFFVAFLGIQVIDLTPLLSLDIFQLAIALSIGLLAGGVLFSYEIKFNRYIYRKKMGKEKEQKNTDASTLTGVRSLSPKAFSLSSKKNVKESSLKKALFIEDLSSKFSLPDISLSAVLEECIYRGCLLSLFLTFPPYLACIGIFFSLFFFGVSHLFFGWNQCICKMIMALLFTILVLITGSLYSAIFGHLFFNFLAYYYQKKTTDSRLRTDNECTISS